MKYNPEIHHRRSIRLKGYDYTQPSAYFVTFCAYQRLHLFGEVVDDQMVLNERGKIARDEWFKTAELRPYVKLYEDEFVIMPNHGHGIIWIEDDTVGTGLLVGARRGRAPTEPTGKLGTPGKGSIPTIVRVYKSAVTYAVNKLENQRGAVLWQRNYYEHVIRNEHELHNIARYIRDNPLNWQLDRDNAQNTRKLSAPEAVDEYIRDVEKMALKSSW
jgi:REP element-mobilizing transposase RayT